MRDGLITGIAWFVVLRYCLALMLALANPDNARNPRPLSGWQVVGVFMAAFASVVCAAYVLGWVE